MTRLLIRLFIRHPEDTKDAAVRTAYGNLASLVGMSAYVEQKSAFVRTHKNPVLLAVSVLAWAASLLGFAEIIGTVYPIFGYISIAFLVFLVIHFFRAKKAEQPQQA